jgi:hypothetical protein
VTRHFFSTEELRALAHRNQTMKRTIEILDRRLDTQRALLNIALQELALERGANNVPDFIRRWEREHQRDDRQRLFYLNEGDVIG